MLEVTILESDFRGSYIQHKNCPIFHMLKRAGLNVTSVGYGNASIDGRLYWFPSELAILDSELARACKSDQAWHRGTVQKFVGRTVRFDYPHWQPVP